MKVSELTAEYAGSYLGYSAEESSLSEKDLQELTAALNAAVSHAKSYTGLSDEMLDEYEDITIAVLGLCNDYLVNNRPESADSFMNKMSEGILSMHSRNLL